VKPYSVEQRADSCHHYTRLLRTEPDDAGRQLTGSRAPWLSTISAKSATKTKHQQTTRTF